MNDSVPQEVAERGGVMRGGGGGGGVVIPQLSRWMRWVPWRGGARDAGAGLWGRLSLQTFKQPAMSIKSLASNQPLLAQVEKKFRPGQPV